MTSKRPEVTVVTANYNCEKFIASTMDSVLKQSFQNWEMIIVDDKSTDRSCEIIETYCEKDNRIQLVKLEDNVGPAEARNTAIRLAQGRFIAFLDSDDQWTPEKLEVQINFMKQGEFALTFTEYKKIDEDGQVISGIIERPRKVSYPKMLNSNYIPCLTAIYDSSILGKLYMPNILKRQDYGLWLAILKVVPYAYSINQPLAFYRVRKSDSVSSNKFKSAIYHWKILRELEKVNPIKATYHFIQYAVIGYIKFRK
ncbi:MAG: glycosyltransferase family 2 protein [Pseudohongiella sp.]|nr:glycosyltransferase family 2 protein [Pseudohongiella sp.]